MTPEEKANADLAEWVGSTIADPLKFVLGAYAWGEPGQLERYDGPDDWQREALEEIGRQVRANKFDGLNAVRPIRLIVSSGHGVGKSTLQAWLVNWIMSTRPRCRGTITANTATQLDTKTWAAIQSWTKLCITASWFESNTQRLYRKGQRESWFCAPQSCSKDNSEAFAGQHAADSTSFYVMDEDSNIEDVIHEVAEGGLTDGEPMIFRFGNCTRSQGSFYRDCFGSGRDKWRPVVVDARTSKFANQTQIAEWITEHGEDSDFVRVRVRGLPPRASDLQYISSDLVYAAQKREAFALGDDPLVCGLDVARGGSDDCVFWFRRGQDARSIPPIRIPGEQARDSMKLVAKAAQLMDQSFDGRKIAMMFVDGTGIGGPIVNRLHELVGRDRVLEIQFGAEPPDPKYLNFRAYMWGKTRDWLARGAIPELERLATDLTAPGYSHNKSDQLVLESKEAMKKRGVDSPDFADALALTFAYPVTPRTTRQLDPTLAGRAAGASKWG